MNNLTLYEKVALLEKELWRRDKESWREKKRHWDGNRDVGIKEIENRYKKIQILRNRLFYLQDFISEEIELKRRLKKLKKELRLTQASCLSLYERLYAQVYEDKENNNE